MQAINENYPLQILASKKENLQKKPVIIIMRKQGVNHLFLNEVLERVNKLKENPGLEGSLAMKDIDDHLRKLKKADTAAGVPPPIDGSPLSLKSSMLKVDMDSNMNDESLEIESIRKLNDELKTDILQKLNQLKTAKIELNINDNEVHQAPQMNHNGDIGELEEVIGNANSRLDNYSNLIRLKDRENQELKSKISQIEDILDKNDQPQLNCRCLIL